MPQACSVAESLLLPEFTAGFPRQLDAQAIPLFDGQLAYRTIFIIF